MYENNIFLFFKIYFWDQRIKIIQNIQKQLIFYKKKIKIFWELGANILSSD